MGGGLGALAGMAGNNFTKRIEGMIGKLSHRLVEGLLAGTSGMAQGAISHILGEIENRTGLNIDAQDFGLFGSVRYFDKIYGSIKNTNQQLGIAGNMGSMLQNVFKESLTEVTLLGGDIKTITEEFRSFIEYSNRNRLFSQEDIAQLAQVRLTFGESYADVFAEFSRAGRQITTTGKDFGEMAQRSDEMGVNLRAVANDLKQNLSVANSYNFQQGRIGLMRMAEYAQRTEVSINSALGLTDTILDGGIEKAIEMSAQLQTLGGEFSQFGDPFQLMNMAMTAPEELQKQIASSLTDVMKFNEELGEITFASSGQQLRLREFAKATGLSFQEMSKSAVNMRKEMEIENLFSFGLRAEETFDNILSKVAGVAEYSKEYQSWVVNLGNETKRITDLTSGDIAKLDTISTDDPQETFKELILSNESLGEAIERLTATLKIASISEMMYTGLYNRVKPLLDEQGLDLAAGTSDTIMGQFAKFFKDLSEGSAATFFDRMDRINPDEIMNQLDYFVEIGIDFFEKTSDLMMDVANFFGFAPDLTTEQIREGESEAARNAEEGWGSYISQGLGFSKSATDYRSVAIAEQYGASTWDIESASRGRGLAADFYGYELPTTLENMIAIDDKIAEYMSKGMTLEQVENMFENELSKSMGKFEAEMFVESLKPFLTSYGLGQRDSQYAPIGNEMFGGGAELKELLRELGRREMQLNGTIDLKLNDYINKIDPKLYPQLMENVKGMLQGNNRNGGKPTGQ